MSRTKRVVNMSEPIEAQDEDASLATRILAGDREAFAAAFRAYAASLHTFAAGYLGSTEDAADLVQDVFVRLWRGGTGRECRGTVRAYLYTAVRNGALNRLRNGRRRAQLDGEVERSFADSFVVQLPAPDEGDAFEVQIAAVQDAIGRLPEKHRVVFLLRWQHGCSYAEIASILGIPLKTVEGRIGKALRLLRRWCLPGGTAAP
jgi:RNA polymerase sigma-70 factor, ECF subfamily